MGNKRINYLDLGIAEYKHTWDRQEELLNQIVAIKKGNNSLAGGCEMR